MTFLAPLMALGAAAITIPIALHFFYRARYRPLPWAPMKFLKEAVEQTSRRLKFQEIILLLLRCAALLFLAAAFMRPGCSADSVAGSGEPIDAVFVIDTSYTMDAKEGDKTRLERAKAAAIDVIDTLPDKSSIQIYSCSDRAAFLGPVTPDNRDQAKQLIQGLEVTSLSTDFFPGMRDALDAAETGTAAIKEIYVFTDMQRAGFERQQSALRAKCDEIRSKPNRNLVFVRCGNPERRIPNVAVTDVELIATIPHTKTRVPFKVTLKNTGREPIRAVKVSLELDGKAIEKDAAQVDQIEPGADATITLTGSLDEAGPRLIAVHVQGDGLEGDNVLYKVVGVREKVRVLMVAHPFAGHQFTDSGDWYVYPSFFPFSTEKDKEKIERYFIETVSIQPHEASPDKLERADVVYLLNAPVRTNDPLEGLSQGFITKLTEFVKKGGGLVIGCGDAVQADAYNRLLGGAGLLPMPLKEVRKTDETNPFIPSAESIDEKSAFGPLRPYSETWSRAKLTKMFLVDDSISASSGAQVIMRTTDNKPLVTSRVVGSGEVIFFTTSLDEKWGKLMSYGDLATPLSNYLLAHLTSRKVPGGTRKVGDVMSWNPPKEESGYELIKPKPRSDKSTDKTRPRVRISDVKMEGEQLVVSSSDTAIAGEYAIVPVGVADPTGLVSENGVAFAVNPDLRETENLDLLSDSEAEKFLGFRPTIIQAGAGIETAIRDRRSKGEWTEYVLLLVLLLLVTEAGWAWFCGKTW